MSTAMFMLFVNLIDVFDLLIEFFFFIICREFLILAGSDYIFMGALESEIIVFNIVACCADYLVHGAVPLRGVAGSTGARRDAAWCRGRTALLHHAALGRVAGPGAVD